MRLRLLRADITSVVCDAVATSSNAGLVANANPNFWRFAGRTNADGALHHAAGPALLAALAELPLIEGTATRCRPGCAVATPGAFGSLRAGAVLHAVAPDSEFGYEGAWHRAETSLKWSRRRRGDDVDRPS